MTWVRLDDQFCDHPKIVEAGPLAAWLYVCGLSYCSRQLTDGFIPAGQVRKLADVDNAGDLSDRLVAAGLWDRVDGGFHVHDYLEYQPSAEKVKADRAATAKRQADWRERKQQERSLVNKKSNGVTNAVTTPVSNATRNGPVTPSPSHPDPIPTIANEETSLEPSPQQKKTATNAAWTMLEALCDELGQDATSLSKPSKDRQLAAAKRLTSSGLTENDLRSMVRWLAPQAWVNGAVDLQLIEKQRGKWELAGKPNEPPVPRGAPTPIRQNGHATIEDPASAAKRAAALESDIRRMEKINAPDWKVENVRRELDKARRAMEATA
jgi:hypothetical protein